MYCVITETHAYTERYEIKTPSIFETGRQLTNGTWTGTLGLVEQRVC